jgi:hypothetical protein
MSLLSVDELRAQVQTGVNDVELQTIIDREEAEIVARYGAHADGSSAIAEPCDGGACSVYLKRRIASVTSISEARALGGSGNDPHQHAVLHLSGAGAHHPAAEGTRWGGRWL